MTDIEKSTRDTVVELREQIRSMSNNIQSFSTAMRSIYEDESLFTYTEAGMKLRGLRDDTRDDAIVCLNQVLPISTKFVTSVSDFFEYYEAMEYEQWCRMIPRILERAVGYRKRSETLRQMYEDTLTPLKQRQDHARLVVTELKELKEEFEREKRELEDTAGTKRGWAIGLAFVPFVNLIATPALASSAQSDINKAVANGAQAAIQEAAARKVSNTLLPALQAFVSGITKAAGFFSVMEQELRKFEGKAEKGKDTQKRLHYRAMKLEARDMKSICQTFRSTFRTALPKVRNDLSAMEGKPDYFTQMLKAILAGKV